ncbi:hypothetical protein QF026_004662 [Streptomyces aurantiacus]|uniref:hypothetical protein n=1 Tax=Streptomyces aurantiacus TaxID=47760 RepID=UPI0027902F5E|nr:hypothetical protein [Streptomyces aurantiacus]MDQ0776196.1 hypothetical protein [Streptomyces aurantiacus]
MTQHSIDDVYAQVTEIKKKLEANSMEKRKEGPKEEPSQVDNWAKAIGFGLDELVKTVKDFKAGSVAAWSTLGAVVAGFVISNSIDKDVVAAKVLGWMGLERHPDKAIPQRKMGKVGVPEVPVTSIDVNRVKELRSSSIALSRSLNDLAKDIRNASREIA